MERTERQRGYTVYRPVIYGNTAVLLTPETRGDAPAEHTHRWTVAIRSAASPQDGRTDTVGGADDISYFIKRVTFKLHETYANHNRIVDKPPFEVTETGWGEFDVQIRVTFVSEANEKPISIHHHLALHGWGPQPNANGAATPAPILAGPINAWQYDEFVFSEPTKAFLDTLLQRPPTPLPKVRRRGAPPHIAYPPSLTASNKGGMPEFTMLMEKEEGERLDTAKRNIVSETDQLRGILIEREKEMERLKKEVESMS
ncbi:NuA4 histone H4 acetyltransferase complex and the SWR1 complex subunit [Tulasnella sp. 330]|nr:NuA4 histone H4 acetyltransferase complex and the SWR1 complex subunit [Tulasnella sp. 330]KAG8884059.1 NuA4 histone H4 acetyltransferase complex and the SWR1 complex subunit [Tulasnella sp. 331]KAG8890523.1 NuA4 histone H4 acetyltransferase complex and the SWR1 complex subunit [Tulasnella sp. 332]